MARRNVGADPWRSSEDPWSSASSRQSEYYHLQDARRSRKCAQCKGTEDLEHDPDDTSFYYCRPCWQRWRDFVGKDFLAASALSRQPEYSLSEDLPWPATCRQCNGTEDLRLYGTTIYYCRPCEQRWGERGWQSRGAEDSEVIPMPAAIGSLELLLAASVNDSSNQSSASHKSDTGDGDVIHAEEHMDGGAGGFPGGSFDEDADLQRALAESLKTPTVGAALPALRSSFGNSTMGNSIGEVAAHHLENPPQRTLSTSSPSNLRSSHRASEDSQSAASSRMMDRPLGRWRNYIDEQSGADSMGTTRIHLKVKFLGGCMPSLMLSVTDWEDLREQLEECGVPAEQHHYHNFNEGIEIGDVAGKVLEVVDHDLWLLLQIIPKEIRPTLELEFLQEVKLRVGQPPQVRLHRSSGGPQLCDISDTLVTKEMLEDIVSHQSFAPAPGKFHQQRAGVQGTLHRISAIWGLARQYMASEATSTSSSEECIVKAAATIGRGREDVQKFLQKIVEDEWYDTAESLHQISDAKWDAMRIPGRLVDAIRRQIAKPRHDQCEILLGLNLRVGRMLHGLCDKIEDLLQREGSMLLLGPAGVGKSTALREISRLLSDAYGKCVVVVDTTNELGGHGDIPHQALGSRDVTRLSVRSRAELFQVMLDAVQNHSAQVVVIDEIRDAAEVQAARSIANQGVILIATAHSLGLRQLIDNPTLSPLVGGLDSALRSDLWVREMRSRTKFEECRKGRPAFSAIIQMQVDGTWQVYDDVARAIDVMLSTGEDLAYSLDPHGNAASEADTNAGTESTENPSSLEVLRPGVSKVPAKFLARLHSSHAYMCCFDGGVSWGSKEAGAGACVFRIHTNRKGEHLSMLDQTVYLLEATVDQAEYAGLLAGVVSFNKALSTLQPFPHLLLVEGDSKVVIRHVQEGLDSSQGLTLDHEPRLQVVFEKILATLKSLSAQGITILLRHRPRRFNKVADRLTWKARADKQSTFEDDAIAASMQESCQEKQEETSKPTFIRLGLPRGPPHVSHLLD